MRSGVFLPSRNRSSPSFWPHSLWTVRPDGSRAVLQDTCWAQEVIGALYCLKSLSWQRSGNRAWDGRQCRNSLCKINQNVLIFFFTTSSFNICFLWKAYSFIFISCMLYCNLTRQMKHFWNSWIYASITQRAHRKHLKRAGPFKIKKKPNHLSIAFKVDKTDFFTVSWAR